MPSRTNVYRCNGSNPQQQLHRQAEIKEELQKLESVVGTLFELQGSQKNDSKRSFSFRKIFPRRAPKKDVTSDSEDFMARIKELEELCQNLSSDGNEFFDRTTRVKKLTQESRDEKDFFSIDRNEATSRTIQTCRDILSKLSTEADLENSESAESSSDDNETSKWAIIETIENVLAFFTGQECMIDESMTFNTTQERAIGESTTYLTTQESTDEIFHDHFCGLFETWCLAKNEEGNESENKPETQEESPANSNTTAKIVDTHDQVTRTEKDQIALFDQESDQIEGKTIDQTKLDSEKDNEILAIQLDSNFFDAFSSLISTNSIVVGEGKERFDKHESATAMAINEASETKECDPDQTDESVKQDDEIGEDEDKDLGNYEKGDPIAETAFDCSILEHIFSSTNSTTEANEIVGTPGIVASDETACNNVTGAIEPKKLSIIELPELQSALSLANIPRFEVVGFKATSERDRDTEIEPGNKKREGLTPKVSNRERRQKARKGDMAKAKPSKSSKLGKPNQKINSFKMAKSRKNQGKNMSTKKVKQRKMMRLFVRKLNQGITHDSSKTKEKNETTKIDMNRGAPETSNVQSEKEVNLSVEAQEQTEKDTSKNSKSEKVSRKKSDVVCRPSTDAAACDPSSIDISSSSVRILTANKEKDHNGEENRDENCGDKEESDGDVNCDFDADGDLIVADDEDSAERQKYDLFKSFLAALQSKERDPDDDEIVECFSPVLSMGDSYDSGLVSEKDDDEYINHYYDFSGDNENCSEDEFDEQEGSYDDFFYANDDDSFVNALQAISRDEATMSRLKTVLDKSRAKKPDTNIKLEKEEVTEERNDDTAVTTPVTGTRTEAPVTNKREKAVSAFPKRQSRLQKQNQEKNTIPTDDELFTL
ncbi:unnamed protein product [Pseudo-nitzschia multistriata]|uniref:Uncharacterized protein n=1 Tax=Pseudo-nitzschia multistriata TaxID=183589 RepID=A0A448Z9X2_9STRA|nr:unnamed protein product [Pseudo-nitzschia multistriata]